MKLTKVRRVLAFKQSAFLIPYIEKCTELRQNSNNDFAKGLWKLFANAVFGKFIESVRNYLDVAICFNAEDCERHISKPNFSNIKIISKDVVLVFSKKPTATLNKCYAVGFAVLDLAKEFMYRKYYDEIKPKLGDCQIVMSDTDSFIISVSSDTPTDNLKKIAHILDFSNYNKSDKLYSEKNKNKLGYFKDELCGEKMKEYCAIRAKAYSYIQSNKFKNRKRFISKCKGITPAGRRQILFKNYKKSVQSLAQFSVTQWNIRSKKHQIQTTEAQKICFSSFDDKRYLTCSSHTLAYGSKRIRDIKLGKCPICKIFNPLNE